MVNNYNYNIKIFYFVNNKVFQNNINFETNEIENKILSSSLSI